LSLKEISTTETYAGTKTINIGSTDEDKVKLNVDKLAIQGSSVELNIVNADLTVTTFDVYGDGSYIGKDAEVKAGKITVYSGSSLSISDGAAVTADTIDNRMGSTVDLSAGVTLTVNGNFENAGTISLAGESSIDIKGSLTGNGTISMVDGILSGSLTDSGTNKIEILG